MAVSTIVSLRLPAGEATRLRQLARRMGRTATEVGAELVSESLRRAEFAFLDFRDSPAGRQACIQGTRLAVWQVISLLKTYHGNVSKTAAHLKWPEAKVHAAIAYTGAFPEEIEEALEDHASYDFAKLSRLLPGIKRFEDLPPRTMPAELRGRCVSFGSCKPGWIGRTECFSFNPRERDWRNDAQHGSTFSFSSELGDGRPKSGVALRLPSG